jgi:hypothetical protein
MVLIVAAAPYRVHPERRDRFDENGLTRMSEIVRKNNHEVRKNN